MKWLIKLLSGYTDDEMTSRIIELESKRIYDLEISRQEKFRV